MSFKRIDTNYTLPARFYTSTEIFEEELERIFYSKWIYVACEADIPKPGDYVTLKLGTRSFFLQRNQKGKFMDFTMYAGIAAMNCCRVRKAIAKDFPVPTITGLTDLDGKLLRARGMAPEFPTEDFGLNPIEVAVIGGLIYVCLTSPAPENIEEVLATGLRPILLHTNCLKLK